MRMTLTVVDPLAGIVTDAVLEADGETPIPDIAGQLARLIGGRQPAVPQLFVNGDLVDARHSFASSPLLEGSVVSLHDPAGCLPAEPDGLVELRVVGGPAAGAVYRLNPGHADIGRSEGIRIRLDDPTVPDHALGIDIGPSGSVVVSPRPGTAAVLDSEPLDGPAVWPPEEQLAIGSTLLELAGYVAPDAALAPSEDGVTLDFNRPPRMLPPDRRAAFQLPKPPGVYSGRGFPVLMLIAPLAVAAVTAVALHRVGMLAISPVMMLSNYFTAKKHGHKKHAVQATEYEAAKARIEQDVRDALDTEGADRRYECPDPAAILDIASGPRRRLWERRRENSDHLLLRVGTLDQPSDVVLNDPEQDEHRRQTAPTIPNAPVRVPLRERGVIGVAGPVDTARAIVRWMLAQTATLSGPGDVRIWLLTDSEGQQAWDWMRWLPHTRPDTGQQSGALIGVDAQTVAARIAELGAIVAARAKAAAARTGGRTKLADPDIVVVLDGSRRLRALPGMVNVLAHGPAVGVYAICLDTEERFLPGECQAVVVVEPDGHGLRVQQVGHEMLRGVRIDAVSPTWCQFLARGMAPVRDVSQTDDAGIPGSSRLLDVLGLEPPTPQAIAARWQLGGSTTMAMLGESYDGPFGIDIRRDGPHGLIAGTTGAGKSELLQTIVASLAVANTPNSMTFVLVDYKGGSAFKDCEHLPHTVGMVTDLDNHLVERALESLGAELKRREHQLADAGAKDIEDYSDIAVKNRTLEPIPRLLIVIDEFASMVRELPDFVTGLVNIAQRGRSLGIHLLLATQRPSGVVSPEIRANTNLRIALRVTDGQESSDVIDAPDAGFISKSTPGRAYVRLGANSLVPFQAGRVGGRRPGAPNGRGATVWGARLDWAALAGLPPEPPEPRRQETDAEITDLKVLVEAIVEANALLGIPQQHSPWLPAMPATVQLDRLPAAPPVRGHDLAPVAYGLDDLPTAQQQRAAVLDFATLGHMLIGGAPRSGRSQLIRTMAGSIARTHSCADVHIYGIDCGSGALLPLTALPHCGAVVTRLQTERATRLINRLSQEITTRQQALSARGFASIAEQRQTVSPEQRLPHIVVFLDRWDGFTTSLGELDGGALTDTVGKMMREGQSVGVHLIITGDRTLFIGRIGSLTEDKMSLRLPDKNDFAMIGVNPRKLPDAIAPGRAYRAETGLETQIAVLGDDMSGQGQAAALTEIGTRATVRDAALPRPARPFRVDVLPNRITFEEAWGLRGPEAVDKQWAMFGVGGDELTAVGVDLADGAPTFIVAGPPKSGRSTALLAMARSLLRIGGSVVLFTPRTSPLRALTGQAGVLAVYEQPDAPVEELDGVLAAAPGPVTVLVDDAELLKDAAVGQAFKAIIATGADTGRALIIAGNAEDLGSSFNGCHVDARRGRRGALLSPQGPGDGDLIGLRLNRSHTGGPVQPGRALLHLADGLLRTVQVPTG